MDRDVGRRDGQPASGPVRPEGVAELMGRAAHDLNNQITIIAGHAQLLGDVVGGGHPAKAHLDAITAASERAATLSRRMLEVSEASTGEPPG